MQLNNSVSQKVKEQLHFIGGIRVVLTIVMVLAACNSNEIYAKNVANVIASDSTKIYTVVDEMPELEGGLSEVYKQIKYPQEAILKNVEGRVFVKFIVNEKGEVKKPEILKDIGSGCGEAAIKGIKKVKFKPGQHNGEPVKVYYTMPINFKLEK